MIGNELWDRGLFGGVMIPIGAVFAYLIWDHSWVLVGVGVANIFFGIYVIWGAFAWEDYKKDLWERYGKRHQKSKKK